MTATISTPRSARSRSAAGATSASASDAAPVSARNSPKLGLIRCAGPAVSAPMSAGPDVSSTKRAPRSAANRASAP